MDGHTHDWTDILYKYKYSNQDTTECADSYLTIVGVAVVGIKLEMIW